MLLRIGPPCIPNLTRSSASLRGWFQMFSILFQSLFLSSLPTIPLLNREVQSPTYFHPTYRLDYSCIHSFRGTILESLSSLLLSFPDPFLMDFWSLWIHTFKHLPNPFPLLSSSRFCSVFLTAVRIWCLANPFSPPLPEYILLHANQSVYSHSQRLLILPENHLNSLTWLTMLQLSPLQLSLFHTFHHPRSHDQAK